MIYLEIAFRIITVMMLILFLFLKTGRRKIAELPVYDFLSIMVLGTVIGADITEPKIPHLHIVFAVVCIVFLQYLVSYLLLHHKKIARKITFGPTVVIQNGQFIKSNMERLKYSVENIQMSLREKDIFNLNEIEFAIVESSGSISVLKKSQFLPLTPSDMNIRTKSKGLSIPLITDGKIYDDNLEQLKLDRAWLKKQLTQINIQDFHDVFYADISTEGKLYVSRMLQTQDLSKVFRL